jgi:hypothetical protein
VSRVLGDRYELIERVGSGGMASVWRARDQVLDRMVAVKLIHEHLADDTRFVEMFRHEARHAASLTHPNVVALHDWGVDGATPFMVMEFVEGQSLREKLRSTPRLSISETRSIIGQVLAALGYAHDRGIVHRDVKPGNILVAAFGTGGPFVKVSDFGIAKAIADETRLTGTGTIGTLGYSAPEQSAGEEPTPAVDIYAVGCVLYECLSGAPPFVGEPVAVALQHQRARVPPLRKGRPDVSKDLESVVLSCLAEDPRRRFASASELAATIAKLPKDPDVGAAPTQATVSSASHERTPGLRGRVLPVALAGVLVVGAVITLLAIRGGGGTTRTVRAGLRIPGATRQLVYIDHQSDVWYYDARRGTNNRLTSDGKTNEHVLPAFLDASIVSYLVASTSGSAGPVPDTFVYAELGGASSPQVLFTSSGEVKAYAWSPDGKTLAYLSLPGVVNFYTPVTNTTRPLRVLGTEQNSDRLGEDDHRSIAWSPDGQLLLVSDTHLSPPAQGTMWVLRLDGSNAIDPIAGTYPLWSRDGKTVFFKSFGTDQRWFALSLANGARKPLTNIRHDAVFPNLAPDGHALTYSDWTSDPRAYVYDLRTKVEKAVADEVVSPVWLSSRTTLATQVGPCSFPVDCYDSSNALPTSSIISAPTKDTRVVRIDRTADPSVFPR